MIKFNILSDFGNLELMIWEGIGVREAHRNRSKAGFPELKQGTANIFADSWFQDPDCVTAETLESCANVLILCQVHVNGNSFVDLDTSGVQDVCLLNIQIEKMWPRLVADFHQLSKAFGNQHGATFSFPFQQRVCRHCGSHAN
jgi:hypothetical protein